MLRKGRGGFTLIEICIAIVILTAAILGLAASTAQMLGPTADAESDFVALQYVEDRLTEVRMHPRYLALDSIFGGTEANLPGLTGASRVTTLTRTQTVQSGGKAIDYWTVLVTVSGGRLKSPVFRSVIVGAP